MTNVYYDAYTEIYEILSYMPISYIVKLPKELLNLFEQKRNKDYIYHVNPNKKITEQEMLIETKAILANLYRDFWATPKIKEMILQQDKTKRWEYQEKLREENNPDNIFKNKKQVIQEDTVNEKVSNNSVAMVEYKESIFKKIINIFKKKSHKL